MRGRLVERVWKYDPRLYAPPRCRRACKYEAFIPQPIARDDFSFDVRIAGSVSDAEAVIRELNGVARPALEVLANIDAMELAVAEGARVERVESGFAVGMALVEGAGSGCRIY